MRLSAAGRMLSLDRPLLMGVVNASPDSFSDPAAPGERDRFALARRLLADGADLLDVGGESAVTGRPAVPLEEEIERVVPLVERLVSELGATVSVDTYKPAVARAAIAAGAVMVNDVSGLRDPELADVCAQTGAALVVMHTAAAPRERLQDPGLYADVAAEVVEFLGERITLARSRGVGEEQLLVDPGPDFAKTPAQTVAVMKALDAVAGLGHPVLLAVSRKDFVGALTGRPPGQRLAGTLAAVGHALDRGAAHVLRVHDVREVADFLRVGAALRGEADVPADLALADDLRHEK